MTTSENIMPVFVWFLLAAACLFALQLFPPTGIFLMFVGAGLITGGLLLLSLVALFVEALIKRVPRWLTIVPVLATGGYYGLLVYERLTLPSLPNLAGIEQPIGGLVFDPEQHAIDQGGIDPNYLLARYQVERVYDSGASRVRTVGETRSCEKLSYFGDRKNTPGAPIGIEVDAMDQFFCFSVSDVSTLEQAGALITFDSHYSKPVVAGVQTQIKTLSAQLGRMEIGSVSTLSAEILRPFPLLFAGCGLNSGTASWQCGVHLYRDWVEVWPSSASIDEVAPRQTGTDQVAKLLSLTPRPAEELSAMTRLPDAANP